MNRFRRPVRLGVWYIRTSTWSGKSTTKGDSSEAHDGSGVSRVPRSASVRIETFNFLLRSRAFRMHEMSSCSDLPM